jgi:hypothetical protein
VVRQGRRETTTALTHEAREAFKGSRNSCFWIDFDQHILRCVDIHLTETEIGGERQEREGERHRREREKDRNNG